MHGRLSPPFEGRFQAFPADSWREEFARARDAGLVSIEWIHERPHLAENPIGSASGLDEIRRLSEATGVRIRSICADYFMTELLIRDGRPDADTWEHLRWLIGQAAILGLDYIVLPFVDSSSLRHDAASRELLATQLGDLQPLLDRHGLELHLETDLPPSDFAGLLDQCPPGIRANYDTGNSASLGYRPSEELAAYGHRLGSVHIKDRLRGGGTVEPGTGDTDFAACFAAFLRLGYDRPYILQTARGQEGGEVELAIAHRRFVEEHLEEARHES